MSRPRVKLDFQTDFHQPRQVLTGLLLLEQQGTIDLDLTYGKTMHDLHPDRGLVRASVDGRPVAFDVNDGYWYDQETTERLLTEVDLIFKRSWNPTRHAGWAGGDRIRPLGFNYQVELPHAAFRTLDRADKKSYIRTQGRLILRHGIRPTVEFYEVEPRFNPVPTALFYTRLWDPHGGPRETTLPESVVEPRIAMNAVRAECLRLLREQCGPRFTGGLEPTPYALKQHPELVRDRSRTSKRAFLAQVHSTEIGVTSLGLDESNGQRIGEFIAASRAVVSERLHYLVPGDYTPGLHYQEFTSAERCVEIVVGLLEDPDTTYAMQIASHSYYLQWLRPDRLVWHALQTLLASDQPAGR